MAAASLILKELMRPELGMIFTAIGMQYWQHQVWERRKKIYKP